MSLLDRVRLELVWRCATCAHTKEQDVSDLTLDEIAKVTDFLTKELEASNQWVEVLLTRNSYINSRNGNIVKSIVSSTEQLICIHCYNGYYEHDDGRMPDYYSGYKCVHCDMYLVSLNDHRCLVVGTCLECKDYIGLALCWDCEERNVCMSTLSGQCCTCVDRVVETEE